MKFRTFHRQQQILHTRVKHEFITQDEKHVTFTALNKMNGSLRHLHPHTFLWHCHEVYLIYWQQDKALAVPTLNNLLFDASLLLLDDAMSVLTTVCLNS